MAIASKDDDLQDFSPSSTVVSFDPPVPLLRGPIPASPADDPAAGQFVLSFRDASSWRSAFRSTQSKLVDQCLISNTWKAGARVGCSISASNKCKPPWWKSVFGVHPMEYAERERCEEREIALCLAASKESCAEFAKEKCLAPFRDARIAFAELNGAALHPASRDASCTTIRGSWLLEESA